MVLQRRVDVDEQEDALPARVLRVQQVLEWVRVDGVERRQLARRVRVADDPLQAGQVRLQQRHVRLQLLQLQRLSVVFRRRFDKRRFPHVSRDGLIERRPLHDAIARVDDRVHDQQVGDCGD